jgi:hypothetical protein
MIKIPSAGNTIAKLCNVCKKIITRNEIQCKNCSNTIFTPIEINTVALCGVIGHFMPDKDNIRESYVSGTMPNRMEFDCVRCCQKITLNYK